MKPPERDNIIYIGHPASEDSFVARVLESKITDNDELIAHVIYLQNRLKATMDWVVWDEDYWRFRSDGITGKTVNESVDTFNAIRRRAKTWNLED